MMDVAIDVSSDEFLFAEDLLEGGITLAGGSNEATDGDDVAFGEVDGSVVLDLSGGGCTSLTASWMLEWSLLLMMRSV